MKFIKMHGIGNDYVFVDCFKEDVANPAQVARDISHRHFGVGSDGLILIKPWSDGDGEMEMYNADGSRAEMCGNGLRCVAKYIYDHHNPGKNKLNLLTGRGPLLAIVHTDNHGLADSVTIDMDKPIFPGSLVPVNIDKERVIGEHLSIGSQTFTFSSISMGNPHCVIFVDDVESFPVTSIGPKIETHPLFPARVNVEFVQKVSSREFIQRTWERGSGETWACGTGASAVAVVAVLQGMAESSITIHLKGGDLKLEYQEGDSVKLTGPAVEAFQGEWPL